MIPVPPKLLRRLVIAPLVVAVELLVILLSPALLLVAAVISPFFGGWRPVRMSSIVLAFAARHLAATLACFGLWVAGGFGLRGPSESMVRAHYAVMGWFVSGVYRTVVTLARVEVRISESEAAERVLATPGNPVLVLSRHAGEGDTLLVIHELLCRHGRGPRVVMHEALRLDPLIDVLGDRLPNRFVDPRGGDTEVEIAAMAEGLGETAALVIFPEGRNFSAKHRERGIERLDRAGHTQQAGWAREMRHLSAPRPGGALAAIEAAPTAEIIVMGHDGFPTGLREVWDLLPEPQVIEVRLWHEPRTAIPLGHRERIDWLFGRWRALDDWVEACREADAPAPSEPERTAANTAAERTRTPEA
jgi:1-acyl-sn-glycerol-3-phosphate acyltransferase